MCCEFAHLAKTAGLLRFHSTHRCIRRGEKRALARPKPPHVVVHDHRPCRGFKLLTGVSVLRFNPGHAGLRAPENRKQMGCFGRSCWSSLVELLLVGQDDADSTDRQEPRGGFMPPRCLESSKLTKRALLAPSVHAALLRPRYLLAPLRPSTPRHSIH